MKIYTRKGDKGQTGVFGGKRESKDSPRIECNGAIDEANATLGLLRSQLPIKHEWQKRMQIIQKDLMDMMSHLARPSVSKKENPNPKPIHGSAMCETWIDEIEAHMSSPSDYFLLPGGNLLSSLCHVFRTQIRRAERRLISLEKVDPDSVEDYAMAYLNRLSDLAFLWARRFMEKDKIQEERWQLFLYKRKKKHGE
ncbi:MAG: cob(I)yrinic acid a,c-diamide adenosyltransferase [Cytophagales bacterium]|nr:cob(I)yrinic acid a,c-diamide adenosyltransferase [Cytophagales bacterium]